MSIDLTPLNGIAITVSCCCFAYVFGRMGYELGLIDGYWDRKEKQLKQQFKNNNKMNDSNYISQNYHELRQASETLSEQLEREVKISEVQAAIETVGNKREDVYAYVINKNEETMVELIAKVEQWGRDRNIIQEAPTVKQAEKTLEECGELLVAVATDNKEEIIDAIGDIQVTMILQCAMQGISYVDTLKSAYNVIKDRKGKLINGKFVKEAE